jgi:hypothetical protein
MDVHSLIHAMRVSLSLSIMPTANAHIQLECQYTIFLLHKTKGVTYELGEICEQKTAAWATKSGIAREIKVLWQCELWKFSCFVSTQR